MNGVNVRKSITMSGSMVNGACSACLFSDSDFGGMGFSVRRDLDPFVQLLFVESAPTSIQL